jgi:hypothetical protein
MSETFPLPKNIDYFQVVGVNLDPRTFALRLEVIDPIETKYFTLEFDDPIFISISKTPDCDDESIYQLGELKVDILSDPTPVLTRLGYGFTEGGTTGGAHDRTFHMHLKATSAWMSLVVRAS